MDHWLPDNLSAQGVQQAPGQFGPPGYGPPPGYNSPYDPLPSFHTGPGGPGAWGPYGPPPPPPGAYGPPPPPPGAYGPPPPPPGAYGPGGYGQQGYGMSPRDQQIAMLNTQMDNSGSAQAALHNNRLRKQIGDLDAQRMREGADSAIFGGAHRSEMAAAGQSIADKLGQVEKAINTREGRAGDSGSWLSRSGGPTTLSNFLPQALNKITGAEAGAQQVSAELQELYRARMLLNQQLAAAGQNR